MKKIFAMIMTICLMASALCVTTLAAEATDGLVLRVSALKDDGSLEVIEEYDSFETGWNFAMEKAKDYNYLDNNDYVRIVVDLLTDWEADADGVFGDSDGVGFRQSTIYVPESARVMLNMNGHTIDRGLGDNNELDGEVICIEENSDVIINGGKNGDEIARADDTNAAVQFGTIKGGNSDNGAGGIHIQDDAQVTLNNVKIVGNVADDDDGGGIAMYDSASLIMNGGGFLDNKNDSFEGCYGAAIYIYNCTAKFNKVLFSNNQFTYKSGEGAAISSQSDSVIEVSECKFINNGNWNEKAGAKGAVSVIYMSDSDSQIDLKNTVFEGNGSSEENLFASKTLCVLVLYGADLTMDNCTFTKNHARDYVINTHTGYPNEVFAYNSTFTNNDGGVFLGDVGEFTNCTFDKNGGSYTFSVGMFVHHMFVLRDCSIGNSTFENKKCVEIVDTDAENGAASIFGEGSLALIVASVALIASIASIIVNVTARKKKTDPVTKTESSEEGN